MLIVAGSGDICEAERFDNTEKQRKCKKNGRKRRKESAAAAKFG